MRFRSLALALVASGCALVDASGEAHGPGGSGGASYKAPINLPASANPRSAAIAEVNGIPGPDVAVVRDDGVVQFFVQMGMTGQFQMMPPPSTLFGYTTIISAKLDTDDGFDELVAAGSGKLDVIVHDGSQPDMIRRISLAVPAGFVPRALAASFDPTGSIVAAADASSMQVFVFRDVLGTPSAMTFTTDEIPNDVAVADVDGSMPGPEVLISHRNHITSVSPTLTGRADRDLVPGTQARFLAVGELGGGPAPDVAYQSLSQGPGEIGFMFGSPSGLVPQTTFTGQGTAGDALLGADVDGDGASDLVSLFTDNSGKRMLEFFVRRPGDPMPLQFEQSTLTIQARALTIATGDLNLDGRADFVLVPSQLNGVDVLESN